MADSNHNELNRRKFIQGGLAGAAFVALPLTAYSAENSDLQSVLSSNTEDA